MRRPVLALLVTALLLAPAGCGGGDDERAPQPAESRAEKPVIRLGTKDFSEQFILGELYAQALRAKGFEVQLKADIGASEIVDQALTLGSIDMYPEYTGVLLSEIAEQPERPRTAAAAYDRAKRFQERRGFTLLDMAAFENANALVVKPEFARRHRVRTIADLARVPGRVTIGAPPEFRTRFEGLEGLRRVYGLDRARVRAIQIGRQYGELDRGGVDVAAAFTTDGQLGAGDYRVLGDPERLFSFQNLAPVVSRKLLQASPEAGQVVDAVTSRLTTAAMRRMNAEVALDGRAATDVAKRFLEQHGLL